MKKKLIKIGTTMYIMAGLIACNINMVSAKVTFNQSQAQTDVKSLLDPISNFLLFIALPITAVTMGIAYAGWNAKDEQEKESMPFHKVAMKHIVAFVIFGLSGAALKWFSIS
ncbi:hypothetical protein KB151_003880 [[Clostridium] innocuum]|nr:hypothetical protein [[Clostridium] innocuum]